MRRELAAESRGEPVTGWVCRSCGKMHFIFRSQIGVMGRCRGCKQWSRIEENYQDPGLETKKAPG